MTKIRLLLKWFQKPFCQQWSSWKVQMCINTHGCIYSRKWEDMSSESFTYLFIYLLIFLSLCLPQPSITDRQKRVFWRNILRAYVLTHDRRRKDLIQLLALKLTPFLSKLCHIIVPGTQSFKIVYNFTLD
jgi:hypothetical protein